MASNVLVIKLGALGDFIQALGPMRAIRDHHGADHLTLMTTAPYEELAKASGLFDAVWLDRRPRGADLAGWLQLRRNLRGGRFARVYDLQTSDRSSFYFRLFWPGPTPEWSGIAKGCSHPHANPKRDDMHTHDRQREQLAMAGIDDVPAPDVSWATADVTAYGLKAPFALLAAGGAAHRPAKRWSRANFADLAGRLSAGGVQPVYIGGAGESPDAAGLEAAGGLDLCGRTSLLQLAELGRRAKLALGNDTGPMHLLAAAGCASVVLYSHDSDPALCAQRGPGVHILRRESLDQLSPDEVWSEVLEIGGPPPPGDP